jgi:hypothetical protein
MTIEERAKDIILKATLKNALRELNDKGEVGFTNLIVGHIRAALNERTEECAVAIEKMAETILALAGTPNLYDSLCVHALKRGATLLRSLKENDK